MPATKYLCGGIAAALLLATPLLATAQGMRDGERQPPREGRMFQLLDTNADGKVSLDEIKAEQRRLLGAADVDGDGDLSADEFRRRGRWFRHLAATSLFDLMDADGDGKLTAAEIGKPSERWFARYDANDDGQLDTDEAPQHRRRQHRR